MLLRLAAAAALLTPLALAGDVLVVASSGSGDFTYLQAAVDAAAEGDTIVVEAGTYAVNTVIAAKSLDIVAMDGGADWPTSRIDVLDLAPSQTVRLAGLGVRNLRVEGCLGPVVLEDLNPNGSIQTTSNLLVLDSPAVTVTNSSFTGDCDYGWDDAGAWGGPAVYAGDSQVRIYHSALTGGWGNDDFGPCGVGGFGGPGIWADTGSTVRHSGCSFVGGAGGYGTCSDGGPGPGTTGSGTLLTLATPVTQLVGTRSAAAGSTVALTISGPPGAIPMLVTSAAARTLDLAPTVGTLHLAWPFALGPLPPIPASGTLLHTVALPPLPPDQAQLQLLQVVHGLPGSRFLGPPLGLTVLGQP